MDDKDRMPRNSYDLIDFLDKVVARPAMPTSATGFANLSEERVRQFAFTAGSRQLVDELIAQRAEETKSDEDEGIFDDAGTGDGPVLRGSSLLPSPTSSVFVVGGEAE